MCVVSCGSALIVLHKEVSTFLVFTYIKVIKCYVHYKADEKRHSEQIDEEVLKVYTGCNDQSV